MEKFEEKIIDLVDVISEPEPDQPGDPNPTPAELPIMESSIGHEPGELELLVRTEVERLIKSTINDSIQKMIKEIMIQEVEKAVSREIESLKRT